MLELKHPYPSIYDSEIESYGGSQLWSDVSAIRKCGCGVVAALDVLFYLCRYHRSSPLPYFLEGIDERSIYIKTLKSMSRRYFLIVPPFGITGPALASGLMMLIKKANLDFKASIAFSSEKIWARTEEMLSNDIPVILAIGQNFPRIWQQHKLNLYFKTSVGHYRKNSSTKAHYVTVTGMDEKWLQVSSWGKKLYINRFEFERYVREHSISAISNIIYIKKC